MSDVLSHAYKSDKWWCADCNTWSDENTTCECPPSPRAWRFTVAGVPKTKARPRFVKKTGRVHSETATVQYEQRIAGAAVEAGLRIGDSVCAVHVLVWLPDKKRKDLDNILKVVLDGLVKAGKMALYDDSIAHVRSVSARLGGYDKANPRIEIIVMEVLP